MTRPVEDSVAEFCGYRTILIWLKPEITICTRDEIDLALVAHHGFMDEELDFIINYDLKYRMGLDAEADDE